MRVSRWIASRRWQGTRWFAESRDSGSGTRARRVALKPHPDIPAVADALAVRRPGHTLRVAVDGRTAAGKTTFAGHLAEALRAQGRDVVHAGIDGFHNPRAVRYAKGRMSAEGYYRDARDLPKLKAWLLEPLGPGGSGRYATASLDLEADVALEPGWREAPDDLILIVDGTFLQRPELAECWDSVIYLDVSAEVSRQRGTGRDGAEMADAYAQRYLPAFDMYLSDVDPLAGAEWVLPN